MSLDLDNSMCVYEGKHLSDLTKDSTHNSTKTSKMELGFLFSFYTWSETLNPTRHMGLGWLIILQKITDARGSID